MYLARVYITLKTTVNDPVGVTIRSGLHDLGFSEVQDVRSGKYMEMHLDTGSKQDAESAVRGMCEKLLVNPVIEEYHFDLRMVE